MKKITLLDFKKLCDEENYTTFIYSSDNQDSTKEEKLFVNCIFNEQIIEFNPGKIYFKNGRNFIKFSKIKYIINHEEKTAIGDIFDFVCDNNCSTGEIFHTVVIR